MSRWAEIGSLARTTDEYGPLKSTIQTKRSIPILTITLAVFPGYTWSRSTALGAGAAVERGDRVAGQAGALGSPESTIATRAYDLHAGYRPLAVR